MKLEPVYLVAPRRQITTRRAFAYAVGSGLAGILLGFSGTWLAMRNPGIAPIPPADPELLARVRWATEMAKRGSLQELMGNLPAFLAVAQEAIDAALAEPVLLQAVQRAADHVVRSEQLPQRRLFARILRKTMRLLPASLDGRNDAVLAELDQVAR